jgi:hypothetical protein
MEKQRRTVLSLARSKSLAWTASHSRRLFAELRQLLLIPEHVDELVTRLRPHLFHLFSSLKRFYSSLILVPRRSTAFIRPNIRVPLSLVRSSYVVLLSPLCPPTTRLAAVNRYASNHQHQPNRFPPLHLKMRAMGNQNRQPMIASIWLATA